MFFKNIKDRVSHKELSELTLSQYTLPLVISNADSLAAQLTDIVDGIEETKSNFITFLSLTILLSYLLVKNVKGLNEGRFLNCSLEIVFTLCKSVNKIINYNITRNELFLSTSNMKNKLELNKSSQLSEEVIALGMVFLNSLDKDCSDDALKVALVSNHLICTIANFPAIRVRLAD